MSQFRSIIGEVSSIISDDVFLLILQYDPSLMRHLYQYDEYKPIVHKCTQWLFYRMLNTRYVYNNHHMDSLNDKVVDKHIMGILENYDKYMIKDKCDGYDVLYTLHDKQFVFTSALLLDASKEIYLHRLHIFPKDTIPVWLTLLFRRIQDKMIHKQEPFHKWGYLYRALFERSILSDYLMSFKVGVDVSF